MRQNQQAWSTHYGREKAQLSIPDENVVRYIHHRLREGSINKESLVLDLGCGAGRNLVFLRSLGLKTLGHDFALEGIRKHEDTILALAQALPYVDRAFDLVIAWGVLHYLEREEREYALQEIARVLRPGGRVFLTLRSDVDSHLDDVLQRGDLKSGGADFFDKDSALKMFSGFSEARYGFIMRTLLGEDKVIAHHMIEAIL